jgi:hypothetical protein
MSAGASHHQDTVQGEPCIGGRCHPEAQEEGRPEGANAMPCEEEPQLGAALLHVRAVRVAQGRCRLFWGARCREIRGAVGEPA